MKNRIARWRAFLFSFLVSTGVLPLPADAAASKRFFFKYNRGMFIVIH